MGGANRRSWKRACVQLAALGAIALCGCQGQPVFEPDRHVKLRPSDFAFAVEDVAIPVREGGELDAWWIPSQRHAGSAVLFLHGNDGNVASNLHETAPLRALGYAVLIIDYRGFGRSTAMRPTEASVYQDAEAAWRYLVQARGLAPERLFIYGHSLGGAVAIELALRHPEAGGLVVESSFTSLYDMARLDWRYAWLPRKPFLTQFDSLAKVPRLDLPVLFLHGTADEIVPFSMGEKLYRASGGDKRFVAIPGGRHEHEPEPPGSPLAPALGEFLHSAPAMLREAAQ